MAVFKVVGKDKAEHEVVFDDVSDEMLLNGVKANWDVSKVKENSFHIIRDNKSYNVEVLGADYKEKSFLIKVNGEKYNFEIKDRFDELLHTLGMDNMASSKVSDLKAPMPGLVLEISAKVGETVKKGDALLILEAMKMENIIKSPTDGMIKSISVGKGDAIEKNQLILNFE